MKKIIISLSVIGVVAAIVIGATTAYFSDTETSTGNTFTAGAIDLKIDNESYVTDPITGNLMRSENTSWNLADSVNGLFDEKLFFNFTDLKPGDIGEDTISIHVNNNDAWACMGIAMTENSDNTCTEPESEDDNNCNELDTDNGELADELQIAVWADDGDNVYETHEQLLQLGGPNDPIVTIKKLVGLSEPNGLAGVLTLADSGYNLWSLLANDPLPGNSTRYIGKAWCFGTLTGNPKTGEDQNDLDPLVGTGFNCDGGPVNNASQTDRVKGDISFYAVQARNNDGFLCSGAAF